MARTFRTIPAWIAAIPESDSFRASKHFRRAARGQDGAIRSEIAQSAKAGKLDYWSTSPKGRANKRRAVKQIRRYNNGEASRQMEAERLEDWKEAQEAKRKATARAYLNMMLEWAEEDKYRAERDLHYAFRRLENLRAEIRAERDLQYAIRRIETIMAAIAELD